MGPEQSLSAVLPAGPPALPLVGHMLAFRRDPLAFLTSIARAYPGEVVRFRQGPRTVYLVKHPDLVKEILVTRQHEFTKSRALQWAKLFLGEGLLTSEGEFHTRQRRLAQPAFHRQRIAGYAAEMVGLAREARERWRAGETVLLDAEMTRLTLAIAARTLFGLDVTASAAAEVGRDVGTLTALFPRFALPLFGVIQKLPLLWPIFGISLFSYS